MLLQREWDLELNISVKSFEFFEYTYFNNTTTRQAGYHDIFGDPFWQL